MKEVFKKVIEKFVIPEFPWVVDYEIILIGPSYTTYMKIIYCIDVKDHKMHRDCQKLRNNAKLLYKMIGGVDDIFIKFINKNDEIV